MSRPQGSGRWRCGRRGRVPSPVPSLLHSPPPPRWEGAARSILLAIGKGDGSAGIDGWRSRSFYPSPLGGGSASKREPGGLSNDEDIYPHPVCRSLHSRHTTLPTRGRDGTALRHYHSVIKLRSMTAARRQFNTRLASGLSSEKVGTSISNFSPLSLTI